MTINRTLIRPTRPLGQSVLKLSSMDHYMLQIMLPMMCVFEVYDSVDREDILHNLQMGLARTID